MEPDGDSDNDRKSWRPPVGSSPGIVLVHPEATEPEIEITAYGPTTSSYVENASIEEAFASVGTQPVVWINVEGLGDADVLKRLGDHFGMHRLAIEDVATAHQRSKVDDYDEGLFIVVRAPGQVDHQFRSEQVSFFLGSNFLLTFQEGMPGDCFANVRDRIRRSIGRIRRAGADYLLYALIDAVVDAYFPTLEEMGERLDSIEKSAFTDPSPATLAEIRVLRRDLLAQRRAVWPLREAIHSLLRDHTSRLDSETVVHLRDCYDHCVELLDLLEMYRDLASGLMDVFLSCVNNRMNEVMRVLTIVSTVFIPMSFVAGVYGMNFKNMPELNWPFGYGLAWIVMGAVGIGLMAWFWRKGWLRQSNMDSSDLFSS